MKEERGIYNTGSYAMIVCMLGCINRLKFERLLLCNDRDKNENDPNKYKH